MEVREALREEEGADEPLDASLEAAEEWRPKSFFMMDAGRVLAKFTGISDSMNLSKFGIL